MFGDVSAYAAYCSYAAAKEGRYQAAHDALISSKQDLDKKIWDWKLIHGRFRVKKTHPMENLPTGLNRSKGKGAKMVPANLVSIRLDYEDSN